jgi:hypothetical protein
LVLEIPRIPEMEYGERVERGSAGQERVRQAWEAMEQQTHEEQVVDGLVCLECRAESALARGWRAYVDADSSLLVYCPPCAAREFDA